MDDLPQLSRSLSPEAAVRDASPRALPADDRARAVLAFWFGAESIRAGATVPRDDLWFRARAAEDRAIRERFGPLLAPAMAGELDGWAHTPLGCLALVVALDQFPRNVHRRTPAAFAGDEKARAICEDGLRRGVDRTLSPLERTFFYLPLQHAEDREAQARSVALYEGLAAHATDELRAYVEKTARYAREHRAIVERFGRFPHRNAILGRPSSPAEAAWLDAGGATFGQ